MVSSQVGCCREGAAVAVSWVVAHLRTSSRQQAMTTARRPSPRNCLFHLFLLLLLLLLVVEGGVAAAPAKRYWRLRLGPWKVEPPCLETVATLKLVVAVMVELGPIHLALGALPFWAVTVLLVRVLVVRPALLPQLLGCASRETCCDL